MLSDEVVSVDTVELMGELDLKRLELELGVFPGLPGRTGRGLGLRRFENTERWESGAILIHLIY